MESPDGTVYGAAGKVLHFSLQRFRNDVVEGGACFMCGRAESAEVPFNSEHVVPDWLQSMMHLHSEAVTLANDARQRYGGHKIQCCQQCNSDLGKHIEEPVSELLKAGYPAMKPRIDRKASQLLHAWAALIFLKMHLRDSKMRWSLDTRIDNGAIGDVYNTDALHHVQCLVRTALFGGEVEANVFGTSFVHQASNTKYDSPFDYADHTQGRASMVRVGDLCFFNVFDDAGIVMAAIADLIARCGPLASPQAREVLAHLAYTNIQIVRRPTFMTTFIDDLPVITGHVPEPYQIRRYVPEVWGSFLYLEPRRS